MKNILTDKANTDFIKWLNQQEVAPYAVMFDELPKIIKTAYITQWLNSLQYQGENLFLSIFQKSFAIKADFMSFEDVTNQTIEVCNKIYYYGKKKMKSFSERV